MIWNLTAETMSPSELRELQRIRLQTTVAHAFSRVPFYAERFRAAGVRPEGLRSLEDLVRFPFLVKRDLRDHYPFGLFAVPMSDVARLHASSGTRGKPTVVGYTKSDLDVWSECIARCVAGAGGRPGDVVHNAYGYGLFTGGLGLHDGIQRMGATVVPASGGFSKRQVELMKDFGAKGLCCTPSYALNLAETMHDLGLTHQDLQLTYGIFGAEPWTLAMRTRIEQVLGIDAVDIYGLSEVMGPGVACECQEAKNGLHVMEDHFLIEIVDRTTLEPVPLGETGEVVFTSLTKQAFPVIRYRTGDLAALLEAPCVCGRTTRRMTRVKGRVDDMLIVRGVNVFPQEIEAELLGIPAISPHYQIVLTREGSLDQIELHVEWATLEQLQRGSDAVEAEIANAIHARIQVRPTVRMHAPRTIARSEGKAIRVVDRRQVTD